MIKKYLIVVVVISFLNYLGCYSYEHVRSTAIKEQLEKEDYQELHVVTKDYQEYRFDKNMYTIKKDSLLGIGVVVSYNRETPFQGKIALNDITDVKLYDTNVIGTIGVIIGLASILGLTILIIALAAHDY